MKITADMHTHSENSHDSVCSIEEMCLAQIEKGTNIMAVTDHADIYSFDDYDIYTPIEKTYKKVEELNRKYGDRITLLSGIEISEGFWFPEKSNKMRTLCDYDVIIGSVHCVKYGDLTIPYSRIDFSSFSEKEIYDYLDFYFDDMYEMLEKENFDVLAHLTCPIRYITGKYSIDINMEKFRKKIDKILSVIIEKNIALEVNTSSYDVLGDFFPSKIILKQYFEMGGCLLTMGSDAHVAENASIQFEKALQTIREIGFDKMYYYKKRKPVAYGI